MTYNTTISETVVKLQALWLFPFYFCIFSIFFFSQSTAAQNHQFSFTNDSVKSGDSVPFIRDSVSSSSLQQIEDSVSSILLREIEVTAGGNVPVKRGGSLNFNPLSLSDGIRIMGEADVINHLKHLSGITTSGDYGSGIMIDGAEPSQSLFRINKVPVFFPYRFGGIFSTFNSEFFANVDFERGIHSGEMPNRLGSKVDFFNSRKIKEKLNGAINVGMLSSSLNITIPIAEKIQISFAGRISYVDQVYGPLLKGKLDMGYKFGDLNLNILWKINDGNSISLNAFGNKDQLNYLRDDYSMENKLSWSNRLLSVSWDHNSKITASNRIYFSDISNRYEILMPQLSMNAPAAMAMAGVAGDFSHFFHTGNIVLNYGYEVNYYREQPQVIDLKGFNRDIYNSPSISHPLETRIYGDFRLPLKTHLNLYAGLSASYFNNHSYRQFDLNPRITLNLPAGPGAFNLHLGRYTQYLHQLGFSQIGLASDFWMAANQDTPRQKSYNLVLDYTGIIHNVSFSISGYWKQVYDQPDYIGQVLDLLEIDYNASNHIISYNGFNTGVNLMTFLKLNKFTADVGFGYGIARRKDEGLHNLIRGNTEPGFTCNADISYNINSHWQIGAQFRLASGRPYTPIVAMYLIAGNLIKEYGPPNSALFPCFNQLDLSATWKKNTKLKSHSLTHLVNFSFINAYGRKNVEIMTYVFDFNTGNIRLRKVYSLYRFLPSISYTLQF